MLPVNGCKGIVMLEKINEFIIDVSLVIFMACASIIAIGLTVKFILWVFE